MAGLLPPPLPRYDGPWPEEAEIRGGARPAALPAAAVVVEERYSALFKVEHVHPGWLPELIARLQVRYPSVPIVFAETRKFAEEWTYRFLAAAAAELVGEPDVE